jgi:hypothetical protein
LHFVVDGKRRGRENTSGGASKEEAEIHTDSGTSRHGNGRN